MKSTATQKNRRKTMPDLLINNNSTKKRNIDYIRKWQNLLFPKQFLSEKSPVRRPIIEYTQITDTQAIAVTKDSVWIHTSTNAKDSDISTRRTGKINSIETSKKLLDTAIVMGKRAASVEEQLPSLSVDNWVWSLIGQYHLTHPTPQLMTEAARQFKAQGRDCLAKWAAEKAQEETGHDRLALRDIQSLGYKAQALAAQYISPSSKALINYFIRSARASDPIKVVGYAYTLERIALAVTKKHIQAIESRLPAGINATRCLRVHSSTGSDVEHVDEALETIALLSSDEQTKIAIACYETARLYFSIHKGDFPAATELRQKLQPFQV